MSEFDDFEDINDVFVTYNFAFSAVRVVENTIMPAHFEVRADVVDQPEVDEFQLNLAFTKIKFFFTQVVNNKSLIFCHDNGWANQRVFDTHGNNTTGNTLIITPDDPSDEHLAAILQAKLNALANGAVTFGLVEIKSDNLDGLAFSFAGHAESVLPTMDEWVGDHSYFTKPWWSRNDASTLDVIPPPDADLSQPPSFAYSLDFLSNLMRPTELQGATVVRPEFRPTVIDGGKR